jgi:hypothetical protein
VSCVRGSNNHYFSSAPFPNAPNISAPSTSLYKIRNKSQNQTDKDPGRESNENKPSASLAAPKITS